MRAQAQGHHHTYAFTVAPTIIVCAPFDALAEAVRLVHWQHVNASACKVTLACQKLPQITGQSRWRGHMRISYAQNFEDVILWRALHHVEKGMYIDIGAQDPLVDSVSLTFYKEGWRGVHVEPSPSYASLLRTARPDERVIEAAVGRSEDTATFYDIPDSGLSTTCAENARHHASEGRSVLLRIVASRSLASILDEYRDREIHWMKIDAEGGEKEVLESWRPSEVRPWVVLVESTEPNSRYSTHERWEHIILSLGYELCYFDGLNRFYLSRSHPELKPAFEAGPNVFDAFALNGTANAWFCRKVNAETKAAQDKANELATMTEELARQLAAARDQASELTSANASLQAELDDMARQAHRSGVRLEVLQRELDTTNDKLLVLSIGAARREAEMRDRIAAMDAHSSEMTHALHAIRSSTSWRVTSPLRGAKLAVSGISSGRIPGFRMAKKAAKRLAAPALTAGISIVERYPELRPFARAALSRFPTVHSRLRSFAVARNLLPKAPPPITWMIEPAPDTLNSWTDVIARNGKRSNH